MTKLVELNFNNNTGIFAPAFNGVGDLGAIRTSSTLRGATTLVAGAQIVDGGSALTMSGSGRTPRFVTMLDSNVAPTQPMFDVWFSQDPTNVANFAGAVSGFAEVWSLRFVINFPAPSGANSGIVAFGQNTSPVKATIASFNGGGWGWAGVDFAAGNPVGSFRVELQVDKNQTPNTVLRIYANDGTTQFTNSPRRITLAGTNYAANFLRFGDLANMGGTNTWSISEIEIWNTNDMDGLVSNNFGTATGQAGNSSYAGAPKGTTYSIPVAYSVPGETVTVTNGFKTFLDQTYGNNNRKMDVYIPQGTAPASGWPCVIWAHAGFFTTGDKNALISHWRNRFLNAGYAVVSVNYIPSTMTNGTYNAYGASDNPSGNVNGYGRYPSWVVDYKLATVRIRDKYAQGKSGALLNDHTPTAYGIDPNRLFAAGYSAGGYIAAAAACTRDLTSDGTGTTRNMTIVGNTTYRTDETSTAYTGTDPTYLGCFIYHAPLSFDYLVANDWSHNFTNAILWPPFYTQSSGVLAQSGASVMNSMLRAMFGIPVTSATPSGTTVTNANLSNLIAQQQAAAPAKLNFPLGYSKSATDYLVTPQHEANLATAVVGTQLKYQGFTTPATHDMADEVYRFSDVQTMFDAALMASYDFKPHAVMAG